MPRAGNRRIHRVAIDKIRSISWLPEREELGDLMSLAKSIIIRGDVDIPVKVRIAKDGNFERIWGKRRIEAAKLAGLREITCIIEDIDDEDALRQHAIENIQRMDKNFIEEAEFFAAWGGLFNRTYEEIARKLGVKKDYIYNRVELLGLDPEVIKRLRHVRSATNSRFGLYHARLLLKMKDPYLQHKLVDEVLENRLSTRQLEQRIEEFTSEQPITRKTYRNFAYYDLTHPIYDGMQSSKYLPSPRFFRVTTPGERTWNVYEITMATHTGTHIDAPSLIFKEGKTIGQFPPEKFIGDGVVLNARKEKCEEITKDDLERGGAETNEGDIVLIYTGWYEKYGTIEYYQHPFLSQEAAEYLLSKKPKMIGLDVLTPEIPETTRMNKDSCPIHSKLLSEEVLIIENICNLKDLLGKRIFLNALPLNLEGAGEAPARVLAKSEEIAKAVVLPN